MRNTLVLRYLVQTEKKLELKFKLIKTNSVTNKILFKLQTARVSILFTKLI